MLSHHHASPVSWCVVTSYVTIDSKNTHTTCALVWCTYCMAKYCVHTVWYLNTHAYTHARTHSHTQNIISYFFMRIVFCFIFFRIIMIITLLLNKHVQSINRHVAITVTLVSSLGMITLTYLSLHCTNHKCHYTMFHTQQQCYTCASDLILIPAVVTRSARMSQLGVWPGTLTVKLIGMSIT